MNAKTKAVRDYWKNKNELFRIDTEILTACVGTITTEEDATLEKYVRNGEVNDAVILLMHKLFNRHNDVSCGITVINEDNSVTISDASCLTELDITLDTLKDCNKHYMYHIDDITKDMLTTITFETIAEVTAAVLRYNASINKQGE